MKPFTYHLYHTPTGLNYYGVRYKQGCSPDDLWTTYFSSSPLIHKLIEEYGKESFVPSIRQLFDTAEKAVYWESKFLTKIDAQHNDKWLNRHNGQDNFIGPHIHTEKTKLKIGSKIKGIKRSKTTILKMKIKAKEREDKRRSEGWTMPLDAIDRAQKTRQSKIAAGEINPYSEERNKKMAESKKGTKRHYLPDGSFIMIKMTSMSHWKGSST